MEVHKEIRDLIAAEQARQGGLFVPNEDSYLEKLGKQAEVLMHRDANGVLGYVYFYCNAEDKIASYVTLIGTSIGARGKGIGYALLNQVFEISRQRGYSVCELEVRKGNAQALDFYKKAGFASVEDRGEKYLMRTQLK